MLRSTSSFIKENINVPEDVRNDLFKFIKEHYHVSEETFSPLSWKFLAHLLNCCTLQQYQVELCDSVAYLIPIPKDVRDKFAEKHGRGRRCAHENFLVPLRANGLLIIHPYEKGKCYRYEVEPLLRQTFLDLMVEHYKKAALEAENPTQEVNLATGQKVSPKAKPKSLLSKNKNRLKNIQAEAVETIEGEVSVNIQLAYEKLLPKRNKLRDQYAKSEDSFQLQKDLASVESDLMNLARLQEQKVRYEYQRLIDLDGIEREFKVLVYWQVFDYPSDLGRIYDRKSAYMNISGDTKSALRYAYDQGEMQWNYDAVACYPSILKGLAEKYDIYDPLFQDRDIKTRRQEIIEETKLPKGLVKFCFNSTIFGAKFPSEKEASKALDQPLSEMPTIPRMVWEQTLDPKSYFDALNTLRPYLKPYSKFINEVRKAWCNDPDNQSGNGKAFINAVGRRFPKLSKYTREDQNRLQTFILQGIEGAFIQNLIVMGSKYGYRVTHCEHDGVTAVGNIPLAAIEQAKQKSGYKYAILEEKDNLYQEEAKSISPMGARTEFQKGSLSMPQSLIYS